MGHEFDSIHFYFYFYFLINFSLWSPSEISNYLFTSLTALAVFHWEERVYGR